MPLILILVFAGVLLVTGMVIAAVAARGSSRRTIKRFERVVVAGGDPISPAGPVNIRKEEHFSGIPWLNQQLAKLHVAPRLKLLLYQANLKWSVGQLVIISAVLWVVCCWVIYLRVDAGLTAVILGSPAGSLPLLFAVKKRSSRRDDFLRKLPDALEMMVSALRAGHSFNSALSVAAAESPEPLRCEFRQCSDEQNFGVDLRVSLHNLLIRVPLPDLQIVVTAILIQRESGGNLAEVLEKVAHIMRERVRLKNQIRVHTAQGRMTGWILSALPLIIGGGVYLLAPDQISILWTTDIGIKLLWTSGIMIVIGGVAIRKIVNIKV